MLTGGGRGGRGRVLTVTQKLLALRRQNGADAAKALAAVLVAPAGAAVLLVEGRQGTRPTRPCTVRAGRTRWTPRGRRCPFPASWQRCTRVWRPNVGLISKGSQWGISVVLKSGHNWGPTPLERGQAPLGKRSYGCGAPSAG